MFVSSCWFEMLVAPALDDIDVDDDKSSFFTTVDEVVSSTFIGPPSFFDVEFKAVFKEEDPPTLDEWVGLSFEALDDREWEFSRWWTR